MSSRNPIRFVTCVLAWRNVTQRRLSSGPHVMLRWVENTIPCSCMWRHTHRLYSLHWLSMKKRYATKKQSRNTVECKTTNWYCLCKNRHFRLYGAGTTNPNRGKTCFLTRVQPDQSEAFCRSDWWLEGPHLLNLSSKFRVTASTCFPEHFPHPNFAPECLRQNGHYTQEKEVPNFLIAIPAEREDWCIFPKHWLLDMSKGRGCLNMLSIDDIIRLSCWVW